MDARSEHFLLHQKNGASDADVSNVSYTEWWGRWLGPQTGRNYSSSVSSTPILHGRHKRQRSHHPCHAQSKDWDSSPTASLGQPWVPWRQTGERFVTAPPLCLSMVLAGWRNRERFLSSSADTGWEQKRQCTNSRKPRNYDRVLIHCQTRCCPDLCTSRF